MDAATFKDAVQAMHGFSPDMVQYLVGLTEELSEQEREALIKDLRPLHEKAEKNLSEQGSIAEEAQAAVAAVQREVLQTQEGSQHSADMQQAETNLTNI